LIRKLALRILLILFLLASSVTAAVWLLREQLVRKFISSANTYLTIPVQVGAIDVSLFNNFPAITISLKNVKIEDADNASSELFQAKRVSFAFDVIELIKGDYQVGGIEIISAQANLRWMDNEHANFLIFKNTSGKSGQNLKWDLKDILFKNITVTYNDAKAKLSHEFESEILTADLAYSQGKFLIKSKGDLHIVQVGVNDQIYLSDKRFKVQMNLDFDPDASLVSFRQANIKMGESEFVLSGYYDFTSKNKIDLALKGTKTDLNTITSFLPKYLANQLEPYESQGNLYFELKLGSHLTKNQSLVIDASFGATDATFFHPATSFRINQASFVGKYFYEEQSNISTASLAIEKLRGKLNGKSFAGGFSISNPENPLIALSFDGELDVAELKQLIQDPRILEASGLVNLKISFDGYFNDLKNESALSRINSAGQLQLKDVSLTLGYNKAVFRRWSGIIEFDPGTFKMKELTGQIGESDLLLNGQIKNLIPFLLTGKTPFDIDAQVQSNLADVDQLLTLSFGQADNSGYKFSISPLVYLRMKYKISDLKYRRLRARSLSGNLQIKNQEIILGRNTLNAMGGSLTIEGKIKAESKKDVDISARITSDKVNLDSIFYVFENFNQDFISQKHLKGQVKSDIILETKLKQSLQFIPESLIASLSLVISKGQLNDFEPMLGLNKYLDDGGLRKLRFADLKNEIFVQDKTIYIPRMDVKSNLTDIQVSGRHTFDQHIDYHIVAPFSGKKKINKTEAGNALESDRWGKTKLYLKITGTTDNYQVGYDVDAVKQKIASEIKSEVKSFKESFKAKEKTKPKKAEISADDYFDWDNQ
jgi:hypothetical protein